jgi:hypothetical protein
MNKSFKCSVKEHLDAVSLNNKQFEHLMSIQEHYTYKPVMRRRRRRWLPWYQIIGFSVLLLSSIVIVLTDSLNYFDTSSQVSLSSSLIQRMANEVAMKHIKMKPLDVETSEIIDVRNYFSQLSFSPYTTKVLANNTQIVLVGGRYCLIQGVKAVQLRYKKMNGGYVALFETVYNVALFDELPNIDNREAPVVIYIKGIKVSMWVEKGLVMVSTEKFR